MKGAPLWFAGVVLGGWSLGRAVALWPAALPPRVVDTIMASSSPRVVPVTSALAATTWPSDAPGIKSKKMSLTRPHTMPAPSAAAQVLGREAPQIGQSPVVALSEAGVSPTPRADDTYAAASLTYRTQEALPVMAAAPRSTPPRASRLHGDAWLVARPDGGDNLAFGQLGASQAGVRVTYAVDPDRRVALSGRVSAPLRGRGREAAAGVDWQPLPVPLHLLVELRAPLDGGPALPAAQLIGGGAARLPLGFQIEGYAQAGAVRRRGAFADGSARVSHQLLSHGRTRLDVGGGVWGAAQRRVSRVDVGPTAGVSLPAGPAAIRLGVDYRLRVAGRARPGSGPAVTLGGSF